jgi:hypothetical protein
MFLKMNALEKNIKYLWNRRDVIEEIWLCMYSFRTSNIHLRLVKGETSGEYFVSCYCPQLQMHGYDLRQLLIVSFAELQKLTNDPYHLSTIKRVLFFFEKLKREPELMFTE